jgi:hypothetical protein
LGADGWGSSVTRCKENNQERGYEIKTDVSDPTVASAVAAGLDKEVLMLKAEVLCCEGEDESLEKPPKKQKKATCEPLGS